MSEDKKIPWYYKKKSLVAAFLLVGPLALPLVWINPAMSRNKKIIWTIVTGILSYFLVVWTIDSMKKLEEYYAQLKTMGL